jgi:hypothetical protein
MPNKPIIGRRLTPPRPGAKADRRHRHGASAVKVVPRQAQELAIKIAQKPTLRFET